MVRYKQDYDYVSVSVFERASFLLFLLDFCLKSATNDDFDLIQPASTWMQWATHKMLTLHQILPRVPSVLSAH